MEFGLTGVFMTTTLPHEQPAPLDGAVLNINHLPVEPCKKINNAKANFKMALNGMIYCGLLIYFHRAVVTGKVQTERGKKQTITCMLKIRI